MRLVIGHRHFAGVGIDDGGIVRAFAYIIYKQVVEHSCLGIFLLHKQVESGYLVVEHSFRDVQFGGFLPH